MSLSPSVHYNVRIHWKFTAKKQNHENLNTRFLIYFYDK